MTGKFPAKFLEVLEKYIARAPPDENPMDWDDWRNDD